MNQYELMLIIDPKIGEEEINAIIEKIENKMKTLGASELKIEKPGTRRLSSLFHNAKHLTQGYYVMAFFKSDPSLPKELKSFLKVIEHVVRYMVCISQPVKQEEIKGKPVEKEATKEAAKEVEAVEVGEIKEVAQGEIVG